MWVMCKGRSKIPVFRVVIIWVFSCHSFFWISQSVVMLKQELLSKDVLLKIENI